MSVVLATGFSAIVAPNVLAQSSDARELEAIDRDLLDADDIKPFKQAEYDGTAILIHLPTNTARALVMPEPVELQGEGDQMPGVELAFEGEVIGFFATQEFSRRLVSFIGLESGTEYLLQIRASENGIVEPLRIVR